MIFVCSRFFRQNILTKTLQFFCGSLILSKKQYALLKHVAIPNSNVMISQEIL